MSTSRLHSVSSRPPLREGDLLTIPQVLRVVPVGRSTIYAAISAGRLPAYRVQAAPGRRGRLLISRADLAAFLHCSRTGGHTAPTPPRLDVDDLLSRVRGKG